MLPANRLQPVTRTFRSRRNHLSSAARFRSTRRAVLSSGDFSRAGTVCRWRRRARAAAISRRLPWTSRSGSMTLPSWYCIRRASDDAPASIPSIPVLAQRDLRLAPRRRRVSRYGRRRRAGSKRYLELVVGLPVYCRHRAIPRLLRQLSDADVRVRLGVVHGLSTHNDLDAVGGLISPTVDDYRDVRDWATFGPGTLTDVDAPELRDALLARISEDDAEI